MYIKAVGPYIYLPTPQSLAKYAFGMGSLQMSLTTVAFTLAALPVGKGLMTQFLEKASRRGGTHSWRLRGD